MTTFTLSGKTRLAAGLHWQTISSSGDGVKRQVIRLAKMLSYDLAALHGKTPVQVAFASTKEGHAEGSFSAAAAVAIAIESKYKEADFLCAAKLADGQYIYVAKVEGVILPDGDLIGDENSIRKRMLADITLPMNWGKIIAPSSWEIENSEEKTFEELVTDSAGNFAYSKQTAKIKFVSVNWSSSLRKMVLPSIGLLVIASCVIGFMHWRNITLEREAALLAQEQAARAAVEPMHPWKQLPEAIEAGEMCVAQFDGIEVLHPSHWKFESALCNVLEGIFTIKWLKGESGWISHLLEIVPKAVIAGDLSAATMTVQFSKPDGTDEVLLTENERTLSLAIAAQEYGLIFNMAKAAAPDSSNKNPNNNSKKTWKELPWNVKDVRFSPVDVIKALNGPGFRVTSITAHLKDANLVWDLEGIQYVSVSL